MFKTEDLAILGTQSLNRLMFLKYIFMYFLYYCEQRCCTNYWSDDSGSYDIKCWVYNDINMHYNNLQIANGRLAIIGVHRTWFPWH